MQTTETQISQGKAHLKVADEVWIVTALLHREHPEHPDFAIQEIMERAHREGLFQPLRPGIYVHVVQHCVANRPPNSGLYRILFETQDGRRRLFREGDTYDPKREGGKITPNPQALPPAYADLLDWYRDWSVSETRDSKQEDPLLSLRGSGKHLWSKEHADEYVRRLREGWE